MYNNALRGMVVIKQYLESLHLPSLALLSCYYWSCRAPCEGPWLMAAPGAAPGAAADEALVAELGGALPVVPAAVPAAVPGTVRDQGARPPHHHDHDHDHDPRPRIHDPRPRRQRAAPAPTHRPQSYTSSLIFTETYSHIFTGSTTSVM